jgi:hypothetical protein
VVQGHGEVDLERQVSGRGRHVLRDALVFDLLEGYDLVVGLPPGQVDFAVAARTQSGSTWFDKCPSIKKPMMLAF